MTTNEQSESNKRPWNGWVILGVWTLFGLWCGNQTFIDMHSRGMHHSYLKMMLWGIAFGNSWTPVTPLLLWISRKFPFERPSLLRSLPVHLLCYVALIPYTNAARVIATMTIRPFDPISSTDPFSVQFMQALPGAAAFVLFAYVGVTAVAHAIEYRRRAQERELRAAQLESLLSQAQLLSLKMQLHPHFLFNTLNGIVALTREGNNDGAVKMLLGLSRMLRYALDSSGRQEVPLSEEIDFLRLYVDVERMRFPDRFDVRMNISEEVKNAMVPSLVLQPLVENAIRHGVGPRIASGSVAISADREGDELIVKVEDDGVGLPSDGVTDGIGLRNTRSRLAQLYERFDFDVANRPEGGVAVSLKMPFRLSSEPVLSV